MSALPPNIKRVSLLVLLLILCPRSSYDLRKQVFDIRCAEKRRRIVEALRSYGPLTLSQQAIFFTTSDILIELFYNVNISARIHPPLKQITPLKS